MKAVREVNLILFQRYLFLLKEPRRDNIENISEDPHTSIENIKWMCEEASKNIYSFPIDKLNRWLGFVQGCLTIYKIITVQEERDYSRKLFHEAYKLENIDIPETKPHQLSSNFDKINTLCSSCHALYNLVNSFHFNKEFPISIKIKSEIKELNLTINFNNYYTCNSIQGKNYIIFFEPYVGIENDHNELYYYGDITDVFKLNTLIDLFVTEENLVFEQIV